MGECSKSTIKSSNCLKVTGGTIQNVTIGACKSCNCYLKNLNSGRTRSKVKVIATKLIKLSITGTKGTTVKVIKNNIVDGSSSRGITVVSVIRTILGVIERHVHTAGDLLTHDSLTINRLICLI